MKLSFLLAVAFGLSVLLIYSLIERRVNQRACAACGFRVSVDAEERDCPRCGAALAG